MGVVDVKASGWREGDAGALQLDGSLGLGLDEGGEAREVDERFHSIVMPVGAAHMRGMKYLLESVVGMQRVDALQGIDLATAKADGSNSSGADAETDGTVDLDGLGPGPAAALHPGGARAAT